MAGGLTLPLVLKDISVSDGFGVAFMSIYNLLLANERIAFEPRPLQRPTPNLAGYATKQQKTSMESGMLLRTKLDQEISKGFKRYLTQTTH